MAGKHVTSLGSASARQSHSVCQAGRDASRYNKHKLTHATDEPRRSGRANRGQHRGKASSSPAPNPKQTKAAASKKGKKAAAAQTVSQQASEAGDDDDDDTIRCICGNDDPNDKRAFICCDACSVWQHNICMGMHDDDDEVGEHYFCEQCRPEEHEETVQALERGERIWETRNKAYNTEKKMSKNRKAKSGRPSWLKKDIKQEATPASSGKGAAPTPTPAPTAPPAESKETGNKRKRESEAPPPAPEAEPQATAAAEKPSSARQEKRRKSSGVEKKPASEDPDTALISIDKLPTERKRIAQALVKAITDEVQERAKVGSFTVPDGQTPESLSARHATRIEYALQMNHEGPMAEAYKIQFRMLLANLKQNKALLDGLLAGSTTADELATMSSADMASDKLQKERAEMKAVSDRQATIDQSNMGGQKYRHTHKGMELIEDENATVSSAPVARPVRHSVSEADGAGSPKPAAESQTPMDNQRPSISSTDRRPSSQQNFDVNSIWAKTAGSPTQANARPSSHRPSIVQNQQDGAKEDADVDRMLADGDDSYEPPDHTGDSSVVWRGKLVQTSGDAEPTVNARFVAGRDVSTTIPWRDLLPGKLNIDGRLQIQKAEEYLCGLQWSSSSDVSILALTAYDDAAAFNNIFEYFLGKNRYAVVNRDKPSLVKDLYIIPVEPGTKLPEHVEMLEHCTIKRPVEERLLLATFVVARSMGEVQSTPVPQPPAQHTNGNGNGHHLPSHMRQSLPGPSGSPIAPHFSPAQQFGPASGSPIPPNPYSAPQQPPPQSLAATILGELINAPSAQQIIQADPGIDEDRLRNLRKILEEDVGARTDIALLAQRLNAGPGSG